MLKKFFYSFLFSFLIFFATASIAKAACTQVPSNQTTCTGTQTIACSQPRPPAGNVERWCCDTQADCDAAKAAVQQQISSQMATAAAPTAAPAWYNTGFGDWYGKVYDPNNPSEIFGERYTAAQVQWVIYGLFSFLINTAVGPKNAPIVQCFLSNPTNVNSCIDDLKKAAGLADLGSSPIAVKTIPQKNIWELVFATDRPISGIGYIKNEIEKFHLVPEAQAQTFGFGYQALNPIQNLWAAMRDISYGFFVIAAIVLAFMIMFRVKISPQVVISVQSAIPKIVVALILVTFSYAIAGFLIDLMYVVYGIISVSFVSLVPGLSSSASGLFSWLTQGQPLGGNVNLGVFVLSLIYIVAFILGFIIMLVVNIGLLGTALVVGAGVGIGVIIGSVATPILTMFGILLTIFIVVVIIVFFVKTIFSLIKAFANILLLTVFAPLQITAGIVIPNFGFGSWFRSYVSNLAVFVVTSVLFLFSFLFLGQGFAIGMSQFNIPDGMGILSFIFGTGVVSALNPAVSSAAWPPLIGGGNSPSGIGLSLIAVSLVIFTLIPKANDLIQAALSGKPFAYGTAIGEALGPAYGVSFGPRIEGLRRGFGEASTKEDVNQLMKALRDLGNRFTKSEPKSV